MDAVVSSGSMPGTQPQPPNPPESTRAERFAGVPSAGRESHPPVALRLFGPMEVRIGDLPLPRLRSRKGSWLLAILALRGGRPVDRDWLAGTLWPDSDEVHARRSLRQTLHDLRNALGNESERLASDGLRTLRLDLSGATCDALIFEQLVNRGDEEGLGQAVSLYCGPLLEDCSEDWAVEARARFEQLCIRALEMLASSARSCNDFHREATALQSAARLDPYREDLLRPLMSALAAAGNQASALTAFRQFRAMLARELAGEPAAETIAVFQEIQQRARLGPAARPAGSPDEAAALPPHSVPPAFRLPIPLTPLIGREQDVQGVEDNLGRFRLVTLTGTGGVGKTRLAIQVAHNVEADGSSPIIFLDLAPLATPDLLVDTMRTACGVAGGPSHDAWEEVYEALGARRLLLVLDNCEHLRDACRAMADRLLSRCAALSILATSRHVLGLPGEAVFRVSPLAVPALDSGGAVRIEQIGPVSSLSQYAAVKLFADRASSAEPSFSLAPRNVIAVAQICCRLEGLPLAIELVAARSSAAPVLEIAARLADRFRLLLGPGIGAGTSAQSRHETLKACIDWSFDLLTEGEQALLSRMSIFAGGWTLDAAEAICADASVPEWSILELLTSLVDKSLVTYQPHRDRYRMLETIREYAMGRLRDDRADPNLAGRFVSYYTEFAEEADNALTGPDQVAWLNRLESEHDNLRAAMATANDSVRRRPDSDESADGVPPDGGLRLAAALGHFWWVRGFLREGRARLEAALESGPRTGRQRARALNQAGTLVLRHGDYSAALEFYSASLAINRQAAEPGPIASVLNNLGMVAYVSQEYSESWRYYSESLDLRREIGDRWAIAASLNNLGTVAYRLRNYEQATTLYGESLDIRRELGDSQGIAGSLNNLAAIAIEREDYAAAREFQRSSLPIRQELGDRQGIAGSLEALAECAWRLPGNATENERAAFAAALLGAAEAVREQVGAPLLPDEREAVERITTDLMLALGPPAWEQERARGRMLDLAAAIGLALA
jgi:predicted ATPase/DNA-binding SARP family transcriptional activator